MMAIFFLVSINMKYTREQITEAIAYWTSILNERVNPSNRRMKLFDDAKHYGAEIIENTSYIACVCRNYAQTHVFGRAKPKVDDIGEILPQCNKRDDEGINDVNKSIRDSEDHPYVQDNLGFDDQPFEAGWCVMGGNKAYYNSTIAWGPDLPPCGSYVSLKKYCTGKNPDEVCPLIVIMEKKNGKLYITNARYEGNDEDGMLNLGEGWAIDDFNCERNGFNEGGIGKRILADGDFADIVQKSIVASLAGFQDVPQFDVVACAKAQRDHAKPTNFATVRNLCDGISKCVSNNDLQHVGMDKLNLIIKLDKKPYSIVRIKEGRGSAMVFDVSKDSKPNSLLDLYNYIENRKRDDVSFIDTPIYVSVGHMDTSINKNLWIEYNQSDNSISICI